MIAVLLGYLLGGEALGLRTILGTLLVLVSVAAITFERKVVPPTPVKGVAEFAEQ